MDIKNKIQNLSNDDLIQICKEIYDWRYVNGFLNSDGVLSRFANNVGKTPRDLEKMLIDEVDVRFNKVATLLICDRPTSYLKIAR